jgi:hypothetical protein
MSGERSKGVDSFSVLMGRLMWFLIGPAALLFTAFAIVNRGTGWLTGLDLGFLVIVALMIGGRWLELSSGSATTATGQPATPAHFRRYVQVLVPLAVLVWIAANTLGNHLLRDNV